MLRVPRSRLDEEIAMQLDRGQQLLDRPVANMDEVKQLRSDYYTWTEFNEQLLRSRFSTSKVADGYRDVVIGFGRDGSLYQELQWVHEDISRKRRQLESIRQQLGLYESEIQETGMVATTLGSKVFLVHGHDGETKLQVAGFLELITGNRPIILHEQADSSQTVIEKFEAHASETGFAVVLLTADDVGNAKGAKNLNPRARQNVVLELGFFFGALGRRRVVALYEEGVELPSDIAGVLYKPLTGNWHTELARELRAANIDIDLSKLF
jgi:predicted nucleotide-binding protein